MKKAIISAAVVLGFVAFACAPKPASVEISPNTPANLAKAGETIKLTATAKDINGKAIPAVTFTWKSSDEKVAKVDANGAVAAQSTGKATITAAVAPAGEVKGAKDVSVLIIKDISVEPAELSIKIGGDPGKIAVKVLDDKGGVVAGKPISFTVSDPAIAEVGPDGTVTAKKAGAATVTAKGDGLEKAVNLKVEEAEKGGKKGN